MTNAAANLSTQVQALRGIRVLCLGDVMLDRYVYGEVSRVSPEAPIPVCRVTSERAMLGGAGNVVHNLAALGAGIEFITSFHPDSVDAVSSRLLPARIGALRTSWTPSRLHLQQLAPLQTAPHQPRLSAVVRRWSGRRRPASLRRWRQHHQPSLTALSPQNAEPAAARRGGSSRRSAIISCRRQPQTQGFVQCPSRRRRHYPCRGH